jgi:hypothetical protein
MNRIILTSRTDSTLSENLKKAYGTIKPGLNPVRGLAQEVIVDTDESTTTERIVEAVRRGIDTFM